MRKLIVTVIGSLSFLAATLLVHGQTATPDPAFALVVVYDASGSMNDKVTGADGKPARKFEIANHAVVAIVDKLQEFCQSKQTNIEAGLVVFSENSARPTIPLSTFKAETFKQWAQTFRSPSGGTPLGQGIVQASTMLANSKTLRKHILVVTDGVNNVGASPQTVLKGMKDKQDQTSVYFVAFDVSADVFAPVKALGTTVVSAANEPELRAQLDTIVGKRILLEAE